MACPADNTLASLVDGSLSHVERVALLSHIDDCEGCRSVVAALARPDGASAAPHPPLARGELLGRYVILERVGAGGMGVVYAAYDPQLDRRVAIKLLHLDGPEGRSRLHREGKVMARISSAHVITVLDIGSSGDRDFVAMEFIDGATLGRWLRDEERSWRQQLGALIDAGRGLVAAHAEGLVHRDFKPDNVLVSRSGRVVVTDFGLARGAGRAPEVSYQDSSNVLRLATETKSGALAGTPAYMAPEVIDGLGADAASDQFSFCVTCFEALYGVRPFHAPTLGGIRAEIQAARFARSEKVVPAALRRVLARGLSAEPAARFPSMSALLAALERERNPHRRRRTMVIAAASFGALVVAAGALRAAERPSRLCTGAAEKWGGVWDPPRKALLREAFLGTRAPYAEGAWTGVERRLDAYRASWISMHTEACEATRVRGEQTDEVLGLRMSCLSGRLRAARALTDLLASADVSAVQHAVVAAAQLPEVSGCADERVLRAKVAPPADSATAARVTELTERRARVEAMSAAGRYREARELAEPLAAEVRAIAYRPLEADVLTLLGEIEKGAADYKAAEGSLAGAVLAAEAGGHTEGEAIAWIGMTELYGVRTRRFPDAHAAGDHARALLERLGGIPRLEAQLADDLGLTLMEEGKYDDASAELEGALKLREKLEPDRPDLGITLNSLGNLLRKKGDYTGALRYHERALALFERALGPAHPRVALARKNVGNAYWSKGQLDDALSYYESALAIQERALGADHPDTAATRVNIAAVYTQQGKFDDALGAYRTALASNETRLGKESADLLPCLNNIGVTLQAKGNLVEAEAALRRALGIAEKAYGADHPEVETALVNLGDVLLDAHQLEGASAAYRRAVAISEKAVGADHPHTAEDLGGLGTVLLAEKRTAEALSVLERAVRIGDKGEVDPVNLAKMKFGLASALWDTGGDRVRAIALAKGAREVLLGSGGRQAPDVKTIDGWLQARGEGR